MVLNIDYSKESVKFMTSAAFNKLNVFDDPDSTVIGEKLVLLEYLN